MKQIIPLIICFFSIMANLYAEAPELKNVMPNSWRKVTKLTATEEQALTREYKKFFTEEMEFVKEIDFNWRPRRKFENYSIYKQQAGKETFYRIFWTNSRNPDFLSPDINFYQILMHQGFLVGTAPYNVMVATQSNYMASFFSLDIISGKTKVKGILETRVTVSVDVNKNGWYMDDRLKNQISGSVEGWYYPIDDALKKIIGKEAIVITNDPPNTSCLVDPKIPMRYGLQNAFDGDPSTSYVENTDDDLMKIEFMLSFSSVKIKKIAIINGYAQDMTLYKNNNRVKTVELYSPIRDEFYDMELADNTLGWQYIEADDRGIMVKDIYRGNKYNDTCIAEFNLYLDNYGWLFGDIDE